MTASGKRTTIQIDGETHRLLEHLKRAEGASSYAQVIRSLIRKTKRLTKSTMGSLSELPPFRRENRDRLD